MTHSVDPTFRAGQAGQADAACDLRMLAWPARRTANVQLRNLVEQMAALGEGVEIEDFDLRRDWFRSYDVVNINWPEMAAEPKNLLTAMAKSFLVALHLLLWRLRGVPVVWTVHNLRSHEQRHPWLEQMVRRVLFTACRGTIHLSHSARAQAELTYPELKRWPTTVIPYPANTSGEATPHKPGPVRLVAFGHIRPYKNIPHLVRTFAALEPTVPAQLTIAGRCRDVETMKELEEYGQDDRIELHLEWLSDEQLTELVQNAHAVLLPHKQVFNSGAAVEALSLGSPTAITDSATMRELQDVVGREWLRLLPPELTTDALLATIEWARPARSGNAPLPYSDARAIAVRTLDFLSRVAKKDAAALDEQHKDSVIGG